MQKLLLSIVFCFALLSVTAKSEKPFVISENKTPILPNYSGSPISPILNYEIIRSYLWMQQMQLTNGLVESAENTNFISLYDNALTALVFMAQGETQRAERIFDFFNERLVSEFQITGGGFYQFRDAMGNNGERVWMGDNAWLLIALNHYQALTGNNKYQEMANALDNWIRSLQKSDGSLKGGREVNGSKIPRVTEGIITAFVAVKGYDRFHSKLLKYLKRKRWDEENRLFMAWPENPYYKYALDLHSLSALIFPSLPQNGLIDASRFYTIQNSAISGEEIKGFCFDEDKDVIWYEGTAQMALAYKRHGLKKQANVLVNELYKGMIESQQNVALGGLPYASSQGTSYGNSKLWAHADQRAAISSNAWLYFASVNFNPLNQGAAKNIPFEDQFWLH